MSSSARILHSAFVAALTLIPTIGSAQTPTFVRSDLQTGLPLSERLIAGDFNGDGKPDLIVTSRSMSETGIYLMTGHGDGTFDSPARVLSPSFATSIGAADLNRDGILDLVMRAGENVWTLLGAGDGTFGQPIVSPPVLSGYPPLLVDVNHDGHLDLVVAHQDDDVALSLGQGDGSFGAPRLLPVGGRVASVAAGDMDGDGNIDLLAGNIGEPDLFEGATVAVLFGAGDGTFDRREEVPVGRYPASIAVLDANGDGDLDIAASSYAGALLSIAINEGDGTFHPTANYAAAGPGAAITVVADFNADGLPDIASCGGVDLLSVFINAGGTFASRTDLSPAASCHSIAVADFNLDGRPDLALHYFAGMSIVSIFINTTAAPDQQAPSITAIADPSVLWPANGRTIAVTVSGTIADAESGIDASSLKYTVVDEYGLVQPSGTFAIDSAGRYAFTIPLTASRRGDDADGRTYRIVIDAADRAGNEGSAAAVVLVPHDGRAFMSK